MRSLPVPRPILKVCHGGTATHPSWEDDAGQQGLLGQQACDLSHPTWEDDVGQQGKPGGAGEAPQRDASQRLALHRCTGDTEGLGGHV